MAPSLDELLGLILHAQLENDVYRTDISASTKPSSREDEPSHLSGENLSTQMNTDEHG
jgi:hypothetical protein